MVLHGGLLTLVCELSTGGTRTWDDWQEGPAPFEFRHHETGSIDRANVAARSIHFHPRAIGELYGDGKRRLRRHRMLQGVELDGCRVDAVEVLMNPLLDAPIGIVHLDLSSETPETMCGAVQRLARTSTKQWNDGVANLFGAEEVTTAKRIFHVAYAHIGASVGTLVPGAGVISREAQWLRALSTAVDPNDPDSIPFDFEDPDFTAGTVFLSGTWRAQVTLRGAAFVGRSRNGDDPFLNDRAGTYVRSLYLDAFLIGLLQLGPLQRLADRVYAIDIESDVDDLEVLQGEMLLFRQNLWWQHITPTEISNRLLLEFQQRHRSEELFSELVAEVNQFASRLAQRTAERTSAVLGLITTFAVPIGLIMTTWQVASSDGFGRAGIVVGSAIGVTSLSLLSRRVRNMVGRLYR